MEDPVQGKEEVGRLQSLQEKKKRDGKGWGMFTLYKMETGEETGEL